VYPRGEVNRPRSHVHGSLASSKSDSPQGTGCDLDLVTTGDYLYRMRAVGVKDLKARLSEYLRAVRAGETVLVTDREQVIAELRPVRPRAAPHETVDELLDALGAAGELTRARLTKKAWVWRPRGLGLAPGTAKKALAAIRSERLGQP
jgi:prevent-host-death family protein